METLTPFLNSFFGSNSIQIYAVAFILVFLKVILKYIIKMDAFKITAENVDTAKQREVHFDCLRVGVDLALLGLVSFLGVIRLTLLLADNSNKSLMTAMASLQVFVIVFQLLLLVLALLFTGIYDSAEKSYYKGIFLPDVLGCISIFLSVGSFFFISQGK